MFCYQYKNQKPNILISLLQNTVNEQTKIQCKYRASLYSCQWRQQTCVSILRLTGNILIFLPANKYLNLQATISKEMQ